MSSKRKIVVPTDDEDKAINGGIAADPDTRELSTAKIRGMRPARVALAEQIGEEPAARLLKRRGRPLADTTKVATSVRYDRDMLEAFRATGEGWQTRMNDALRDYAKSHGLM